MQRDAIQSYRPPPAIKHPLRYLALRSRAILRHQTTHNCDHSNMLSGPLIVALVVFVEAISAIPHAKPFENTKRQANSSTEATQVDLGYEVYQGVSNSSTGLNTFKG